jgi:hypothetical protein
MGFFLNTNIRYLDTPCFVLVFVEHIIIAVTVFEVRWIDFPWFFSPKVGIIFFNSFNLSITSSWFIQYARSLSVFSLFDFNSLHKKECKAASYSHIHLEKITVSDQFPWCFIFVCFWCMEFKIILLHWHLHREGGILNH